MKTSYKDPAIDLDALKRTLAYDSASGIFTWTVSPSRPVRTGSRAGSLITRTGYRSIKINRRDILEHRLAWLFVYGQFPTGTLDHINCRKDDNRIKNLRLANHNQNMANRGTFKNNKTGIKGISRTPGGRWRAHIGINGKLLRLGTFASPEEAHRAYCHAAQQYFGEFARIQEFPFPFPPFRDGARAA